jgi:hypothetical protein
MPPLLASDRLRLEWAPADGPLTVSPTWVALTTRLRDARIGRGRGDERDTYREGRATFTLDNRDRALEPGFTGSPWHPNVRPNRQIRLVASVGANLLDHQTATMSSGIGSWQSSETTAEWSPRGRDGIGALKVSITPPVNTPVVHTPFGTAGIPVVGGQQYTAIFYVLASVAASSNFRINWYTAAGAFISLADMSAVTVAGQWAKNTLTATAPATAAFAALRYVYPASFTSEPVYVDQVCFKRGADTDFEYGSDVPVFRGLIDSIRPAWVPGLPAPSGGDAAVEIVATDLTKMLARHRLRAPYVDRIIAAGPTHHWPFSEESSVSTVTDLGTSPTEGTYTPGAPRGGRPVIHGSAAPSLSAGTHEEAYELASFPPAASLTSTSWTVYAVVRGIRYRHAGLLDTLLTFWTQLKPISGGVEITGVQLFARVDARTVPDAGFRFGMYVVPPAYSGQNFQALTAPVTVEDAPTHVAWVRDGTTMRIYLNGVLAATTTSIHPGATDLGEVLVGDVYKADEMERPVELDLGHISVFHGTARSAAQIAADAADARSPWRGDAVAARAHRILEQVGIPAALRSIDPDATMTLGGQLDPIDEMTALDYLRLLEQTEAGRLYISSGGLVTLVGRHSPLFSVPSDTWGDSPAAGELQYATVSPDFGEQWLTNRATVQRQGGVPQTAEDAASIADHGVFADSKTGLMLPDDNASRDYAGWIVDHYSEPVTRINAVSFYAHRSTSFLGRAAPRELTDQVTILRRPPGGGAPFTTTAHVEGIQHVLDLRSQRTWEVAYQLSPADTRTYWILGDPVRGVLGSTTRLAF